MFKIKKLNNKGDTLVIVLIGIFVLSILGTLILGVTATNLSMKANENKNEKTFYYAEKAVDELYAGIGEEVMDAVQESYNEVLVNYVSYGSGVNANDKMVELLNNRLVKLYDNKKIDKTASGLDVKKVIERCVSNGYINSVTGYTFDCKAPDGSADVVFYEKAAGSTGYTELTGSTIDVKDIDRISIKNIEVKCISNQGYSSKIKTDIDINIPEFNIDFTDSKTSLDLSDLVKYGIICQGGNLTNDIAKDGAVKRINPALTIKSGSNVTILGNIYADGTAYDAYKTTVNGKQYWVNKLDSSKKPTGIINRNASINIKDSASLTFNSKIINCNNDIEVGNNSKLTIRNRNGEEKTDTLDTMQLFANNIVTKAGTSNANIDIAGNTMLKDDLQIDGNNSSVKIKGNYFGYGYRDEDNDGNEDDTGAITGFVDAGLSTTEHERSSAIVINGTGANVDMLGVNKLILAGRAYIDLDASGKNTSYMTGESVSFKGNQKMYLADTELSGSKVAGTNPIKYSALLDITKMPSDTEITYGSLGLAAEYIDSIVAKKIKFDNMVYFYVRNNNPVTQTQYFINAYHNNDGKRKDLKTQVEKLNVQQVSFSNSVKAYTAGALMQVGRTTSNNIEITNPVSGQLGITKTEAIDLMNVIKNRLDNLTPALKDVSENYILGQDNTLVAGSTSGELPFDYLIDRDKLYDICADSGGNGSRKTYTIPLNITTPTTDSNSVLVKEGILGSDQIDFINEIKNILTTVYGTSFNASMEFGFVLSTESGTTGVSGDPIKAGIIISDAPVEISKDFVGLIISNGEVKISGNGTTIQACEDLASLLFEKCPTLQSVLGPSFNLKGMDETDTVVNVSALKYTDIVDKSNWKKD